MARASTMLRMMKVAAAAQAITVTPLTLQRHGLAFHPYPNLSAKSGDEHTGHQEACRVPISGTNIIISKPSFTPAHADRIVSDTGAVKRLRIAQPAIHQTACGITSAGHVILVAVKLMFPTAPVDNTFSARTNVVRNTTTNVRRRFVSPHARNIARVAERNS